MKNLLLLFLSIISVFSLAQKQKYWVQFNDTKSLHENVKLLESKNYNIQNESKWLRAVSLFLTSSEAHELTSLSIVDTTFLVTNYTTHSQNFTGDPKGLALALELMKTEVFLRDSLTGKGVKIGIIDAGFTNADSNYVLEHIFKEKRVKGYKDFINPYRERFFEEVTKSDIHGTQVWKMVAGYDKYLDIQYGLATNAEFYLARTENGKKEHRVEEDDWISALEWMYSKGVRLVNTSLGYGKDMDNPKEDYELTEMDGKTAMITRAAQIATEEKNMIIVVSAGNSGNDKDWKILTAPADAEGVISVGATDFFQNKAGYSSIGPDFLPYLKPDLSTYSPNGTSFSAPVIAGFIACLLEKKPSISSEQMKEILLESSHLYPYGNNYIGFGIPQADKALALAKNPDTTLVHYHEKIIVKDKEAIVKLENRKVKDIVLFHKTDEFYVTKEVVLHRGIFKRKKTKEYGVIKKRFLKKIVKVKRYTNVPFTTIQIGRRVIEVEWK